MMATLTVVAETCALQVVGNCYLPTLYSMVDTRYKSGFIAGWNDTAFAINTCRRKEQLDTYIRDMSDCVGNAKQPYKLGVKAALEFYSRTSKKLFSL